VLETIELFGTDRAMFASDFPTDKLFGGFDQHLDAYNAIVGDFSDDERRALFAGNANRLYRLGLTL
jgi:predicted TIM-barrel fold metal-dependent hydrolase